MKTISFNLLGNYGRLGNSMFQCAAVIGSAKHSGHEPVCNISNIPLIKECFELEHIRDGITDPDFFVYEDDDGTYVNETEDFPPQYSIDLRGYFQTEKYFRNAKNEVRENFSFKQHIRDIAINKIPEDVCVSVHVRRGDYVSLTDHHPTQPVEYYREALSLFPNHRPVFFSDDIAWCKENFSDIPGAIFTENENTLNLSAALNSDISGYVDMCAMSFCNDHIIANSSFSWWGAWLGQGNVVAPKNWFGPAITKNSNDICPDHWTLI
tara:strand:+ start:63 stop:860 length:798 start_codon:yes stop_codon:yes gene_type:complete